MPLLTGDNMAKNGHIYNYLKYLYFLLALFSILLFKTSNAFAEQDLEMQVLQMYFTEDELVVSSTRAPKPLSQVAENISIVTAKDIEDMNAHTVPEILERVPGVFVEFFGHDFGSDAVLEIQGSEDRHVLVLLDGVQWNFMSGGNAVTNSIPVSIIERIEIVKGPASSAWGSSLGGVINIVTKGTGSTVGPSGTVSASYGERDTQDYRAEISGKAGTAGYYLYAGRQDSDGLRNSRFFENNTFYSKLDVPFHQDMKLRLTAGYSEPSINSGNLPISDLTSISTTYAFFTTASFNAELTEEIDFEASFYMFRQKFDQDNRVLSVGAYGDAGELFQHNIYDEETTGGSAKVAWKYDKHNVVIGTDISKGSLDQTIKTGQYLQGLGAPGTSTADPEIKKWAVFANDTISLGRLSVTPGIRYDYNDITGSFTSPSIGAAYKPAKHTVLRASAARGFTVPPLAFTSGGALFLDPNPSLKPEKIWSYQAGVESWASELLRIKFTAFHHELKDALEKELYAAGPPAYNDLYFNKGKIKREGFELELETVPFHNISLDTGFAYVHKKLFEEDTSEYNYTINAVVKYDDGKSFSAQLAGHYKWLDIDLSDMPEYAMLWELDLGKKMHSTEKAESEIFLSVHNVFNGAQYSFVDRKNPRRWIEGGFRLKF